MRNECLIEVGFQPDLEGQVDFDGTAAEGSNNGVKSTIRALLGVFQKRAVSPHRFLWACWVYRADVILGVPKGEPGRLVH